VTAAGRISISGLVCGHGRKRSSGLHSRYPAATADTLFARFNNRLGLRSPDRVSGSGRPVRRSPLGEGGSRLPYHEDRARGWRDVVPHDHDAVLAGGARSGTAIAAAAGGCTAHACRSAAPSGATPGAHNGAARYAVGKASPAIASPRSTIVTGPTANLGSSAATAAAVVLAAPVEIAAAFEALARGARSGTAGRAIYIPLSTP